MYAISISGPRFATLVALTLFAGGATAQMQVEGQPVRTLADGPCFDAANRYVDCGNGTVTDTVTELVWLADAGCTDLAGVDPVTAAADWPTAVRAAAALKDGTCGLADGSEPGDWRLATVDEWEATKAHAATLGCVSGGAEPPPTLTNVPGTACHAAGPAAFANVSTGDYWAGSATDGADDEASTTSLSTAASGSAARISTAGVWPVRSRR